MFNLPASSNGRPSERRAHQCITSDMEGGGVPDLAVQGERRRDQVTRVLLAILGTNSTPLPRRP